MPLDAVSLPTPMQSICTPDLTEGVKSSNFNIENVRNSAYKTLSSQHGSSSPPQHNKTDEIHLKTRLWDKVFHQDIAPLILEHLDIASLRNFRHAGVIYPELSNFTTHSYFEKTLDLAVHHPPALSNHQKHLLKHLAVPALEVLKNRPDDISPEQSTALEFLWPGGKNNLQEIASTFECRHHFNKYVNSGENTYYSRVGDFKDAFIDTQPNLLSNDSSIFNDADKESFPLFSQDMKINLYANEKAYIDFFNHAESIILNGSASEKLMMVYIAKHLIIGMNDSVNYFPNLTSKDLTKIQNSESYPLLKGLMNYFPEGSEIFRESKQEYILDEIRRVPAERVNQGVEPTV